MLRSMMHKSGPIVLALGAARRPPPRRAGFHACRDAKHRSSEMRIRRHFDASGSMTGVGFGENTVTRIQQVRRRLATVLPSVAPVATSDLSSSVLGPTANARTSTSNCRRALTPPGASWARSICCSLTVRRRSRARTMSVGNHWRDVHLDRNDRGTDRGFAEDARLPGSVFSSQA